MTRRQYFVLIALSLPLVTMLDLPSALRAMFGSTAPVVSDTIAARHQVPIEGRVALLNNERLTDQKEYRRSDSFPDVRLTDQFGRHHLFRSDLVRDKIVCVLFFYSQCTGTCPGTIQMVSYLRNAVKEEFDCEEIQFLAITLDPEHDTPEVLKTYAESRGIRPDESMAEWLFCTGELDDLERIRRSLGLYDRDPIVDADRSQHAALVVFGNDRADRWTAQPAGLSSNDLVETFLRMTGVSERQRFANRIGRSDQFMKASITRPASLTVRSGVSNSGDEPWCVNPSELCSLPDGNP